MLKKCYKMIRGEYLLISHNELYTLKKHTIDNRTLWIGDNLKTEKHSFRADTKRKLINLINKHYEKS